MKKGIYKRLEKNPMKNYSEDAEDFNSHLFTYSRNMANKILRDITVLAKADRHPDIGKKINNLDYYNKLSLFCEENSIENAYQAACEK